MRRVLIFLLCLTPLGLTLSAQSKPPVTRADYGQFETVSLAGGGGGRGGGGGGGGGFSPDGTWMALSVSRIDQTTELRFLKVSDGTTRKIPFGSQPTFSADMKWAIYSIGHSQAEQDRLRAANRPVQNSIGIMNLATGDTATVEGIESFALSPDGGYLAMRRYAPAAATAGGGAAAAGGGGRGGGAPAPAVGGRGGATPSDDGPLGQTLLVRDLANATDTTFGNVGEYVWQDTEKTHRLAMVISAEGKTGNGIHLYDPSTAVLRVIESSPVTYATLQWRGETADLAVTKAKTDERHDGATYIQQVWTGVGTNNEKLYTYDPSTDSTFPAGQRIANFRRPSFSDDGSMMFLGIAPWDLKPPAPARGRGGPGATPAPEVDEPAGVDIWHWQDVDVMAKQKLSAAADRRRNLLAVWHLANGKLVPIGKSFTETVTPIRKTTRAYVSEWAAYGMDRSIGRPSADLYIADLTTGTRTKLKDKVIDRYASVSPGGKYVLFLQDDQYWTINLATKAITNITKSIQTSFVDKESDETIVQKPPFGAGGWTKDDAAVILYDKLDAWQVSPDGSGGTRITNGAADEVRHRIVRVRANEDYVDLSQPNYVSLFGIWTKKSGYGVLKPGANGQVERLVWMDQSVGGLSKARSAEIYAYSAQNYDDAPDLFVGGGDLKAAKQVTATNAFQSKFAWGKSEIVEYKTDKGRRLQGALYYPAGYEAGKRYPMIVYLYETLSDNVHRYVNPSDRDYYNTSVFTSQGYFVLQPDIIFRPREPGLSVVECVTPAVKRVVQMGVVDGARVGVIGHSWGGFDTAFLATHTNGVFAAGIAGAPITDLVSNYGNHHWSSGIAETDHIETGQQRMEVPIYEDLPAYVRNSAVFNVQNMTVPLLIEVGDADGTVFYHQGVELYNIARRARKNVVLLVYNGEDHGLRQKKNQVDYQQRILQWFGHYLKGDEAPTWITSGQSAISRADEVRRGGGGSPNP